jgi:hypothetical protein
MIAICIACTSITLMKWEYTFEVIICDIKANLKLKSINEVLYLEEHKHVIVNIMDYVHHYIASKSKDIYNKTRRRKIGNIASQLL